MRSQLLALHISVASASSAVAQVKIVPGQFGLDITGEPAGFDPKNPDVFVDRPKTQKPAPVLLYIHGGGGLTPGERKVPEFFRSMGFATVAFDAFKINKISGYSALDLSTKLSLPGKQRMLTPVSEQALVWILMQPWADTERIYIYGHSNGARVALVMAGKVDPKNVRLIFAEGPAHCCVAYPDSLTVPVKLMFGDKDTYGGTRRDDLLYTRRNPTTADSTKQWAEKQQSGGKLEIKFYDGGHGQFLGKGLPPVKARGTEWRVGGDAERWRADVKAWVTSK
jgi:dienelactone hydrolase